ncbi:hypothetical protein B0H19DRAFT_185882 [Mycena capillaripes]|nr:hypothetical protein B0H19DRAFT_185882 [Mycena capillaripes]
MSSSPVIQLVSFLTRPLMRSHAPATLVSLQFSLHTAFSTLPSESSLLLSAQCPPPPVIQRACLVSGVRWAEWIRLLSGGVDLKIFLTKTTLAVKLGTMPRRTIWIAPAYAPPPARFPASSPFRTTALVPAGIPMSARMRTALASTRARGGAALNPTRIPTLLSSSYDADDIASETWDSDSEFGSSDCESDSGSSFTSVSTTSSTCHSPVRAVAAAKRDVARYNYPAGVLLGASQARRTSTAIASNRWRISHKAVRKTAAWTAASWRRSA